MRIDGKLVEHIGAFFDGFISGIIFRQLRHAFGIAWLCEVILRTLEIETSQSYLIDSFINAFTSAFLIGGDIVFDSVGGVFFRKIQVADSVIHLVEILFVAPFASESAERLYFFVDIGTGDHLALLDAGIKLGAIRGA